MELQLLYSRILTLLRNEFLAVKWKVYVEEERHRLIIERGGGGENIRDAYGFDAIKLEDDALDEKREVDPLSAPYDQVVTVKEELPSLLDDSLRSDPDVIESFSTKRKRLPIEWNRGEDEDEDDDDGGGDDIEGGVVTANSEDFSFDTPSKRRKRRSNSFVDDDDVEDGSSDDDDVILERSSDEYWTEADLGGQRAPRIKKPELKVKEAFCTICNKYFSSKHYLQVHSLKIHNVEIEPKGDGGDGENDEKGDEDEDEVANCSECDIAFPTASELGRHRRMIHPNKKLKKIDDSNRRCFEPDCEGKHAFSSNSKLRIHKEKMHGATRRVHKCTECDEQFSTQKKRMEHHKATHSGVKVSCAHCEKQFTKRANLNYHIDNVHSETLDPGALNQICDLCGRTFSSAESLYIHQITKHKKKEDVKHRGPNEKSKISRNKEGHPCPICGKTFYHGKNYVRVSGNVDCLNDGVIISIETNSKNSQWMRLNQDICGIN